MDKTPRYFLPAFIVLLLLYWLYAFNSGFGYDALEYLNIGRGLTEGQKLYDYIPSKSPMYYGYISIWFVLFSSVGHIQLSIILTIQVALAGLITFYTVSKLYSYTTAALSALLLMICCFLTEMNFLEPEIILMACIIPAFGLIVNYLQTGNCRYNIVIAGLLLGFACMIKATALFAAVGLGLLLIVQALIKRKWALGLTNLVLISSGFLVVTAATFIYFVLQKNGNNFLFWTFIFPLKYYPGDNSFFIKSLIKLSPVFVLIIHGCIKYFKQYRSYSANAVILVNSSLILGCCLSIALLKSQASHYFFPPLVFMLVPFAVSMSSYKVNRVYLLSGVVVAVLFTIVVAFYRRDALARFIHLRSFSDENQIGDELKKMHVPINGKGLIIDNPRVLNYALHPAYCTPMISDDAQDGYFLAHHPESLLAPLSSKAADYVIFDKQNWASKNVPFAAPQNQLTLLKIEELLKQNYKPVTLSSFPESKLWVRK